MGEQHSKLRKQDKRMQVQTRMDLDQKQQDENANIAVFKTKKKKTTTTNKRAFGQDLTNKQQQQQNEQIQCVVVKEVTKECKVVDSNLQPWDMRRVDDDQFVTDYVFDIMRSLRADEMATSNERDFDFMRAQKDLNQRMRPVLVDWLIEVHRKFKLLPSTYFLCINLLDRYLAAQQLSRKKLQLAGCCCLWISSKYHEIYAPEMDDFIYISDNAFDETDLVKMEIEILKTL